MLILLDEWAQWAWKLLILLDEWAQWTWKLLILLDEWTQWTWKLLILLDKRAKWIFRLYNLREIFYKFLIFKIIKLFSNISTSLMILIYWILLASSRFLYSQTFQRFNFNFVFLKISLENQNRNILKILKMFVTKARIFTSSIIDLNVVTHIEMKIEKSNVYHENRQNLKN